MSNGTSPTFLITSIPSITYPNTTCLPSKCGHGLSVIKNYELFVFLPLLAIDSNPAHACLLEKFSSTNV